MLEINKNIFLSDFLTNDMYGISTEARVVLAHSDEFTEGKKVPNAPPPPGLDAVPIEPNDQIAPPACGGVRSRWSVSSRRLPSLVSWTESSPLALNWQDSGTCLTR